MSRLFIELYLDEDVSALVAKLLRVRGFTVQTTQEAGRKEADDAEQLEYGISEQRAVLTHNRDDFAQLAQEYFAAGRPRPVSRRFLCRGGTPTCSSDAMQRPEKPAR